MGNSTVSDARNITLVMDFYELTMSYDYFKQGKKDEIAYFDMFYRKNPDNGGYVIMAGLQQLIEAIKDMHFSKGDIDYLRTLNMFDEEFLSYLADFKFDGTIWAVKLLSHFCDFYTLSYSSCLGKLFFKKFYLSARYLFLS